MEIRLIFFKEIVGLISLKSEDNFLLKQYLRSWEEKSRRRFFLPKVSLISILQNSYFLLKGIYTKWALHRRMVVDDLKDLTGKITETGGFGKKKNWPGMMKHATEAAWAI